MKFNDRHTETLHSEIKFFSEQNKKVLISLSLCCVLSEHCEILAKRMSELSIRDSHVCNETDSVCNSYCV